MVAGPLGVKKYAVEQNAQRNEMGKIKYPDEDGHTKHATKGVNKKGET